MPKKSPLERFVDRIVLNPETGCWNWTGKKHSRGYAMLFEMGEVFAHRISYRIFIGPIPEYLELDHTCRNKGCVNPNHVEPVTHQVNIARYYLSRTHCKNGHLYTDGSSYIYKTKYGGTARWCKACFMYRHWMKKGQPARAALVK